MSLNWNPALTGGAPVENPEPNPSVTAHIRVRIFHPWNSKSAKRKNMACVAANIATTSPCAMARTNLWDKLTRTPPRTKKPAFAGFFCIANQVSDDRNYLAASGHYLLHRCHCPYPWLGRQGTGSILHGRFGSRLGRIHIQQQNMPGGAATNGWHDIAG
jgi:hypothetical protein